MLKLRSELVVWVAALLVLAACSVHADGPDSGQQLGSSEFARLFDGNRADYEPVASPEALSSLSVLVVRGTIRSVESGRFFGQSADDPTATRSIIMVVDVAEVLNGTLAPDSGQLVYVELPAPGGTAAEVFDRYAPKTTDLIIYLAEAPTAEETPIEDPDGGRPSGQPLFQPVSPQGFVIADGGGVLQPLDFAEFTGASLQDFIPGSEQFPVDPNATSED